MNYSHLKHALVVRAQTAQYNVIVITIIIIATLVRARANRAKWGLFVFEILTL